jgi:hypothetical protein
MSETKNPNPHGVHVGDIWEDCDPRARRRRLTVTLIDLERGKARVRDQDSGRLTFIALDRFKPISTGYRRIKEGS